jgi:light-regulated signal transduction histidine kinase (bacteriophytochrome)/anti-sigma regulatory factor (Ser/Thr protein kinase)
VTGYDRVMVYRFAADGSGAVVAEACGDGMGSFFGLNFPASDIPRQARELYLKNWIRQIPDARYVPLPICPPLNPLTGKPLDLSHSILRSVSPVHRQYLTNIGVVGSMSLSLLSGGQLWGLIVCHHYTPRYPQHRLREACELFAEMTSWHLQMRLVEIDLEAQLHTTRIHKELLERMNREADLADGLIRFRPNLLDFVPASGVGLWIEGRFSAIGATPTQAQVEALVSWLNMTDKEGVFQTDCLPAVYAPAGQFPELASGLLSLSVSRTPRDYVLWFRPEISQMVSWAGSPDKAAEAGMEGAPLTPRHSFAVGQREVRLHAHPWLPAEIAAAHRLRLSLLEMTLRRVDQTAREREALRRQQDQLTQELDRRLGDWQRTAEALKRETERRAVLEAELSQVLRRTVADQEAERLRIARELHDTLGQSLTLLQLGLQGLSQTTAGTAEFAADLASLKTLAAGFGRDLNRLAWEIRPTALDDLGIQTAIRNLLETWSERSGIAFDLHLTLNDERLSQEIETTLYRVLQEALTNVVRHADATRVGVVLNSSEKLVTMIIEDDGHGFFSDNTDLGNLPPKRLGLLGIRERVALVDGSLEVESSPGSGTTMFVRIPLGAR